MAEQSNRKRRTREHVIADLSSNHVERFILLCGWTAQRVMPDYGLDLLMVTFDSRGWVENDFVRFQLKATDSPRVLVHQQAIAIRLDWRDVVYYLNEWLPIILVVYDAKRDRAWWLYLQEALRRSPRRFKRAGTLTVHVPLANVLNVAAVRRFAQFRDVAVIEREESSR
jgi:Domain of unknown function (DUF4365)